MATSTFDVNVNHNLNEYVDKIKESNTLWDQHLAKVKAVNAALNQIYRSRMGGGYSAPPGYGASPANSNIPGVGSSSGIYNDLQSRFMKKVAETLQNICDSDKGTRSILINARRLDG